MAKDKQQSLSEAVELLNESIEVISKLKLPEGS